MELKNGSEMMWVQVLKEKASIFKEMQFGPLMDDPDQLLMIYLSTVLFLESPSSTSDYVTVVWSGFSHLKKLCFLNFIL